MPDPEEIVARGWVITGRVHGVGFRWFVRREADRIGLSGWVRNLPDGSVEVSACGAAGQLTAFEARLRVGPVAARVDTVVARDLPHDAVDGKLFHIKG